MLKATIVILGDKISDLENAIDTIKSESRNNSINESVIETEHQEKNKRRKKESEAGESAELVHAKISKSIKKIKAQLNKAISLKKSTSGKRIMSCELCDYKCKKTVTLKKHMPINHKDHKDNDNSKCPSDKEIFNLAKI